jgi:hypothetical protein
MLAPAASAARATAGFIVSIERRAAFGLAVSEFFDDRNDAPQFLGFAHGCRARPGGFAADIEDFRALRHEFQRVGYGGIGIQKLARRPKTNPA